MSSCGAIPGVNIDPDVMLSMLPDISLNVVATRYAETVADFGRRGLLTDGVMSEALQLKYKEALEYGVMYRAFLMKGNDWYDKDQGVFYKSEYEKEVREAWVAESAEIVRHYLPNASDEVSEVYRKQAVEYLVRKAEIDEAVARSDKYADVLDYGLLWYGLLTPDQEWSNPGTGAYFEKLFKSEVNKIRAQEGITKGYVYQSLPDISTEIVAANEAFVIGELGRRLGKWEGEEIPADLKLKYKKLIEYGVLERSLMMAGQVWYDPEKAEYYRGLAEKEISKAVGSEAGSYLKQMLPEIDDGVLAQLWSQALVDFARESERWRYVYETLKIYPDTKQYKIDVKKGQEIVRVDSVFVRDCCDGDAHREYKLPQRQDVQRTDNRLGVSGQFWYEPEPGVLLFTENFPKEMCLRLTVVLAPAHGSSEFPAELMAEYKRVIEYGAQYLAYMMPGQVWSDVQRAAYFEAKYLDGIRKAKRKHLNDMQPGRPAYGVGRYVNNGGYH